MKKSRSSLGDDVAAVFKRACAEDDMEVAEHLLLASESGLVSEFKVSSQGVTKIGEERVGPNAHTVAVDPKTHEVSFPLKEVGGRPVLRVMRPSIQVKT